MALLDGWIAVIFEAMFLVFLFLVMPLLLWMGFTLTLELWRDRPRRRTR